jgi:hypothetical protein
MVLNNEFFNDEMVSLVTHYDSVTLSTDRFRQVSVPFGAEETLPEIIHDKDEKECKPEIRKNRDLIVDEVDEIIQPLTCKRSDESALASFVQHIED